MNSCRSNNLSLKYQWFKPSYCKDMRIRKYNPKRHEGYVTMDMVGREEWGAMDSAYYVEVDGKRIPNKWDNKVDPNKAFFGEL